MNDCEFTDRDKIKYLENQLDAYDDYVSNLKKQYFRLYRKYWVLLKVLFIVNKFHDKD